MFVRLTGWVVMAGGMFTSNTTTEKLLVALRVGEPLSVTRTLIV